jgi:hypothetical protein
MIKHARPLVEQDNRAACPMSGDSGGKGNLELSRHRRDHRVRDVCTATESR